MNIESLIHQSLAFWRVSIIQSIIVFTIEHFKQITYGHNWKSFWQIYYELTNSPITLDPAGNLLFFFNFLNRCVIWCSYTFSFTHWCWWFFSFIHFFPLLCQITYLQKGRRQCCLRLGTEATAEQMSAIKDVGYRGRRSPTTTDGLITLPQCSIATKTHLYLYLYSFADFDL